MATQAVEAPRRHLPQVPAVPARSRACDILMLVERASERYPQLTDRVIRAGDLLLEGHVKPATPAPADPTRGRRFWVRSQGRPGRGSSSYRTYTVDTEQVSCSCPDWAQGHAPEISGRRLCKHLLACLLWEATKS